ncbi:Uncharacterised protein [Serratia ficaria]|uniref:LPD29 domain-containing protein n=1 Tax=Serratia ficaria TaxID=61651 RepID=UPI002183202B|nr:LPD29 domain-containing protein [Serratia ficaria]CAI2533741.1 Uncharacterised protein [Serratia ficaria]
MSNNDSCNDDEKILIIGSVIYTNMYGKGRGAICSIRVGRKLDGVELSQVKLSTREPINFDVVFERGGFSRGLSISILNGVQWKIYDEVITEDELTRWVCLSTEMERKDSERKERDREIKIKQIKAISADPRYTYLDKGVDKYRGSLAAKNIRKELKRYFPQVKFSVRENVHGSIYIKWMDGPVKEKVNEITCKYKSGGYNGQNEIYEYRTSPFNEVYGSADYIKLNREFSDAMIERAISITWRIYRSILKTIKKPSVEDYKKGRLMSVLTNRFVYGVQYQVLDVLNRISSK